LIADDHVGGVCLFRKNITSPAQVAGLSHALQGIARGAGAPPPWVTIDHEGGTVTRFPAVPQDADAGGPVAGPPATALPSAMALAAAGDLDLAREAGRVAGVELRAMGVHLNFAPVLDVNNNPSNPVIGARAFGESPAAVAALGMAYVDGLQGAGVGATAKHFPGHGDVTVDSHVALPLVDHAVPRLDAVELAPFRTAARAGVAAVMTAHIVFPALDSSRRPATMSAPILTGILREQWHYQGLVISDSLIMRAVMDHYGLGDAAAAAVRAGCDLVLAFGADAWQDEVFERLARAIEGGEIPGDRLAAASARIEAAAARWNVAAPSGGGVSAQVGTSGHLRVAQRIADAAVTVLRDHAGMLPLAGRRLGVAALADTDDGPGPSLATALRRYAPQVRDLEAGSSFDDGEIDCAIAVTCSRGSLPAPQVAAVQSLHRRFGDRLVVVATGDPYDLLQISDVPACLLTYGPDQPSLDAAARALVGSLSPRGRLPVTLPGLYAAGHRALP
jgi:beta-N-acetylhexosaminidase